MQHYGIETDVISVFINLLVSTEESHGVSAHHRCLWWCGSLWRFPLCVSGADATLQTSNSDVTLYNLTNEAAFKHIIRRLICPPHCCVPEVLITLINVNTTSGTLALHICIYACETDLMYTCCINWLLSLYAFFVLCHLDEQGAVELEGTRSCITHSRCKLCCNCVHTPRQ